MNSETHTLAIFQALVLPEKDFGKGYSTREKKKQNKKVFPVVWYLELSP